MRAPLAGPRMVPSVCAALCEEGSHRWGRVHERKEPLDSETLGVAGQDADLCAGRSTGCIQKGGEGAVKLASEATEMGRRPE